MVDQLQLNIRDRLAYSDNNFCIHNGIRDCYSAVESSILMDDFRLFYLQGQRRSGKTHLAIAISELATIAGAFPRIIDGLHFSEQTSQNSLSHNDVVIIDDLDAYLRNIFPGDSGQFVSFVEYHRQKKSKLIFLSSTAIDNLPCDEHVLSRLKAGENYVFNEPGESDLPKILFAMARQRGMSLSKRKLEFLIKRIPRNIPALEDYMDRLYQLSRTLGKPLQFDVLADAL